jgi:SRSO17 transposase
VLEADEAADIEEVEAWAAGLEALHARIAGRFARAEPRRRALAYLRGLLGNVGRKNGWQLAEHAGERTPDGMQRLLATADWDPDRVRDDLRAYVIEHLGDPSAVLVADETGFLKKGTTSVGVQRQYSGTAGKVDNCQLGVFLAYASPKGRAMIDRELYLPERWTEDPERCRAARVPERVGFRTKPELAQLMLERALDAGVPAAWVTADEVYGGSPALREWLEERGVWHVLAVKRTELLGVDGPQSPVRASAEQLVAAVPATHWIACSAGHGAKGRRLYDWTRVELASPATAGMARWLLVRRSPSDRGAGLLRLLRPGGHAACRAGPGGRDQVGGGGGLRAGQGRGRPGPLRGPQVAGLVPPHHAGAAGACVPGRHPRPGRQSRAGKGGRGGVNGGLGLLPLTVPEVRRLLVALVWTTPVRPGFVLAWSRWRRRHQARARRAHYHRRERQVGGSGTGAAP